MIEENETRLAVARKQFADISERLAHPGRYTLSDDHARDEVERDNLRRDVEAIEDRLSPGGLPMDLAEAVERERVAERDRRLAEAPGLAKQARKVLADVEKAAKAHADALAVLREVEEKHNALIPLASEAGKPIASLYEHLNTPAVVEPERVIEEQQWGKVAPGGAWYPSGGVFDGAGRPVTQGLTRQVVRRTIPAVIVKAAVYFQTPTATTVIPGHWPRR